MNVTDLSIETAILQLQQIAIPSTAPDVRAATRLNIRLGEPTQAGGNVTTIGEPHVKKYPEIRYDFAHSRFRLHPRNTCNLLILAQEIFRTLQHKRRL